MKAQRYPPDDPREWLNRAHSNLAQAKSLQRDVYLEDLCFNAQQAAEKAIKGVLLFRKIKFPYVHDLTELLTLLEEAGERIPRAVKSAGKLSQYAVFTRYPGLSQPIDRKAYREAVAIAERVVRWAERVIGYSYDESA